MKERMILMSTHNECLQHIYLWRTEENRPLVIVKYPSYLFHWYLQGLPGEFGYKGMQGDPGPRVSHSFLLYSYSLVKNAEH